MKFREHRGGFTDSMATTVELADRAALIAHVKKMLAPFEFIQIEDKKLHVEKYVFDARCDWDLYLVTLDGYGVLGFTDGPCE